MKKRNGLVNDLQTTLLDDLDDLTRRVPALAQIFAPLKKAFAGVNVDRSARRLTKKEKAKLSKSTIRRGVRAAFAAPMAKANAEIEASKPAPIAKPRRKQKRKLGPEES